MMKKIVSLLTALLMLISVVAEAEESETVIDGAETPTVIIPEETPAAEENQEKGIESEPEQGEMLQPEIPENAEALETPAAETTEAPVIAEAEGIAATVEPEETTDATAAGDTPTEETEDPFVLVEVDEIPAVQEVEEEPVIIENEKTTEPVDDSQKTIPETTDLLGAATEAQAEEPASEIVSTPADVLNAEAERADVLPVSDYANENSVLGFVYRLYDTVLQRKPDEDGLQYWVQRLESGAFSAADAVGHFFNSPEYQHSGKTNEQIVRDCYSVMLNRTPDAEGFDYWTQRLAVGMTPQSILAGFVGSNEFSAISTKYGVIRGNINITNPRDKNYERTFFVYRLYANCLGRNPETDGIEYWCDSLENGTTGVQTAWGFFFSEEFNKNRHNNSKFVQLLYKTILGREYDTDGLIYWTTKLNYSDTREKVLNGFAGSQEFHGQCETAEIQAGEPMATPDDTPEWQYNIRVLQLCNNERRAAGLKDLYTREDLLWDLAMARAQETTRQFSHTRPDGTSCFSLFREQGFYGYLGENIAAGKLYQDPDKVVEAWMNSPGHRSNILSDAYTYLATGYVNSPDASTYCADGKYTGQYIKFGAYSVQSFCNYGMKIN